MTVPPRNSLGWLTAAGLASAVVAVWMASIGNLFFDMGGLFFGILIALYFALYENFRSPIRLALFVVACAASLQVSVYAAVGGLQLTVGLVNSFPALATLRPTTDRPLLAYLFAGGAGAFIVLAAALLAFGPGRVGGASLARLAACSFGGAILGLAGGLLDHGAPDSLTGHLGAVILVWQPGITLLMGLLLKGARSAFVPKEARLSAAPRPAIPGEALAAEGTMSRGTRLAAAIFLACLLGFLAFLWVRSIESDRLRARMNAAYRHSLDDMPPMHGLLAVEAAAPEEVLILRDREGLFAGPPQSDPLTGPHGASRQFAMRYTVEYAPNKGPVSKEAMNPAAVTVSVTQYPNAAWARYGTNYNYPAGGLRDSPDRYVTVKKRGQAILQDSGRGSGGGMLCFRWPSDTFAVSVCYETRQVDEEFLHQYLDKYPSSL